MNRLFMTALVLLLPNLAFAQEPSALLSVKTVENRPVISISNRANTPIEAFLVTVDRAPTGKPLTRIYYDTHAGYKHDTTIYPGSSHEQPLPHIAEEALPTTTLRAVIFSDGSTLGDDVWVQELLHRRAVVSACLEEVMALLQEIVDKKVERNDAIRAVRAAQLRRSTATPATPREENVWNEQIFLMATRSLEGELRINGKTPEVPVAAFQLKKFFSGWLADLRQAKPPLPAATPAESGVQSGDSLH